MTSPNTTSPTPMIATLMTPQGLMLYFEGTPHVIAMDHPRIADIKEALREKRYADVVKWADLGTAVRVWAQDITDPDFQIEDGNIFYRARRFPPAVSKLVMRMMDEGMAVEPLLNFLKNVLENESNSSVEELFLFLEANGLPIDEDGYIIAYRAVRADYKDKYTGSVDNSVGQSPRMARNAVDDRRSVTCSHGFHFAAYDYARNCYGNGTTDRLMVVRIHPKDVVSIPDDYKNQKGRCCAYEVIAELPSRRPLEDAAVYSHAYLTLDTELFAVVQDHLGALDIRDEGVWDSGLRQFFATQRGYLNCLAAIEEAFGVAVSQVRPENETIRELRDMLSQQLRGVSAAALAEYEDEDEDEEDEEEEVICCSNPGGCSCAQEGFQGCECDDCEEFRRRAQYEALQTALTRFSGQIMRRSIDSTGDFREELRDAGFDPNDFTTIAQVQAYGLGSWL